MKKFSISMSYAFAEQHGLHAEALAIRSKRIVKWTKQYDTTVRRGMFVELLGKNGLLNAFAKTVYPGLSHESAEREFERVRSILKEYENYLASTSGEVVPVPSTTLPNETDEPLKFAIEAHLRDFLAKNLKHLEEGLQLYVADGRKGIEFPVDGGRIDILAIDREGGLVVIELKLSQGRNKTLGQLLYYMGWVDANLNRGKSRGMIVANEITPDLRTAVSRVPGVSLAQYNMEFTVELVK